MAFSTNASRFSFLTDDAPDPYEKKKSNKKPAAASAATSKPGSGTAQGKKNKKKTSTTNVGSSSSTQNGASNNPGPSGKQLNSNGGSSTKTSNKEIKQDRAWIEWEKRDKEFVTGSYEMDLEQALTQSKLDFQKEQARILAEAKAKTAKSKKKLPIPLGEFNGMFDIASGSGDASVPLITQDDDALMQQFRLETQLEIERERLQEAQRALLKSRNAVFSSGSATSLHQKPVVEPSSVDDKDATIAQLTLEKEHIEKEYDSLRNRFKKLCSLLSDAELKEKIGLLRDIENMTKVNQDLTEQIRGVCSELEQEKSRSHAAITELRKVHEQNRRRGQSQSENL